MKVQQIIMCSRSKVQLHVAYIHPWAWVLVEHPLFTDKPSFWLLTGDAAAAAAAAAISSGLLLVPC
jgi:hypothetical protein